MNKQEPQIIFEDSHLIVLNKPSGLLSQGEKTGDDNLVDWLRTYLGRNYVGLIHRLDRNTSGIMVVAKRTKAASRLTKALQDREIQRNYLGWVVGTVKEPLRWNHFLRKNKSKNEVKIVPSTYKDAKRAVLNLKPIKSSKWNGMAVTLAEFELETGRSHQIRVQAAAEGLPLLGDNKYGRRETVSFGRPALHAYKLTFPHPITQKTMSFKCDLPKEMDF